MKVFVLEFDRLGKAYVVEPKTLNVYETEKIENNIHYINDKKRNDILTLLCCTISVLWIFIMNDIFKLIGVSFNHYIFYVTLLIFVFSWTKMLSPYLMVKIESTRLNIISKISYNFLIRNMVKNILEDERKEYSGMTAVVICNIIYILLVLFYYKRICLYPYMFIPVVSLSSVMFSLFHNRMMLRRKTLKKLLAELEQM